MWLVLNFPTGFGSALQMVGIWCKPTCYLPVPGRRGFFITWYDCKESWIQGDWKKEKALFFQMLYTYVLAGKKQEDIILQSLIYPH